MYDAFMTILAFLIFFQKVELHIQNYFQPLCEKIIVYVASYTCPLRYSYLSMIESDVQ